MKHRRRHDRPNDGATVGAITPDEKKKLHKVYLLYLDGKIIGGSEAVSADELVATFQGIYETAGKFSAVEFGAAAYEDIERLGKLFEMKVHLFNLRQMQEVLRAAKSGLYHPGAGA